MRTALLLKLDAIGGANALECARSAIRIAQVLWVAVQYKFNGVVVTAYPEQDALTVYANWQRDFDAEVERCAGEDA